MNLLQAQGLGPAALDNIPKVRYPLNCFLGEMTASSQQKGGLTKGLVSLAPCPGNLLEPLVPVLGVVKALGIPTVLVQGINGAALLLGNLLASFFYCVGHFEEGDGSVVMRCVVAVGLYLFWISGKYR